MANTIDKLGTCPYCNESWAGENVYQHLNMMGIHSHKSDGEVRKLAHQFGYDERNPIKFSKVIVHEIQDTNITLYQCPNIRCSHFFNKDTGEEYASMIDFKNGLTWGEKISNSDSITITKEIPLDEAQETYKGIDFKKLLKKDKEEDPPF